MPNVIYEQAQERMPSQREIILSNLRQAGTEGILNTDLVDICIGYRSRIAEMYQMGYRVRVENIERGVVRYTLISEPESISGTQPRAIDVLLSDIRNEYNDTITYDQLIDLINMRNFNVVRKHGTFKN